jgi:diacylglycerol kinase (ATP)
MPKPGDTGLTRIIKATGYSLAGLKATFVNEAAFRQELALCLVMIPAGLWLGETGVERALLVASLLLVLVVELLNSAVEAVVDRFGHENHELSGRAKDIGSAAVFVSLANVLVVWGLILWGA